MSPLTDDQKGLFMLQSNEYFDGKVKSIGFTSSSTGRASVGVMAEGEYTFGYGAAGRDDGSQRGAGMSCCRVRLSGKFTLPAKFSMCQATVNFIYRWLKPTSYLCRYL